MANFKEKINSFVKLIHSTNGVCKMLRNFIENEENDKCLQTACDYSNINRINGNTYKVFGLKEGNLTY